MLKAKFIYVVEKSLPNINQFKVAQIRFHQLKFSCFFGNFKPNHQNSDKIKRMNPPLDILFYSRLIQSRLFFMLSGDEFIAVFLFSHRKKEYF